MDPEVAPKLGFHIKSIFTPQIKIVHPYIPSRCKLSREPRVGSNFRVQSEALYLGRARNKQEVGQDQEEHEGHSRKRQASQG